MRRMMADGETKVKAGFYKQTLNHNAKTGDRDLGVKFNQVSFWGLLRDILELWSSKA